MAFSLTHFARYLSEYTDTTPISASTVSVEDTLLDKGDEPSIVLATVQTWLERDGVEFGAPYINLSFAAKAVMLAECCNLAAKTIDEWYYECKPWLIEYAAYNLGVICWSNADEYGNTVHYLYHKDVGTASFHDPYMECSLADAPRYVDMPFPWSGIGRQFSVFEMLTDQQLLDNMAFYTRPRRLPQCWSDDELVAKGVY